MAKKLVIKFENGNKFVVDSIEVTTDLGLQFVVTGYDKQEATYAETMADYLEVGGSVTISYEEAVSQEKSVMNRPSSSPPNSAPWLPDHER